ncbi:hypothetical protein HCH52_01390 [Oscillospiraceae bacterium HV4-5-C5C]|nr:hypothetical protein [Oscillospiraceae bacterium HV4-5-C5C]
MKVLFKQRLFSWFDTYDIYREDGQTLFTVRGKLSWGHKLVIEDASGQSLGMVKQVILTWLPRFDFFVGDQFVGAIKKQLTLFKPSYILDFNGWQVSGNWMEWDYQIVSSNGSLVASVSKALFHLTDHYEIDIVNPQDALLCLMIVLAIDAEKCSRND